MPAQKILVANRIRVVLRAPSERVLFAFVGLMDLRMHDGLVTEKAKLGEITKPGHPRPIRLREEQMQGDYVSHTRGLAKQKAPYALAATVPRSVSGRW